MSALAERLAAFERQAASSGVTVHVHTGGDQGGRSPRPFLRKAVAYACIAGGMIAAYSAGRVNQVPEIGRSQSGKVTVPQAPGRDHYDQIRAQLKWVTVKYRGTQLATLDAPSRLLLSKAAAERANLAAVGLSFKDVYGLINAETSWIPREGASKDGTPNEGIAQFEPATARALGVVDTLDPVESVHVAAKHMKEAAIWAGSRLVGQKLDSVTRAQRIREGVSIYYNLSTKGRRAWDGKSMSMLPEETVAHIENARAGAREAALLEARHLKEVMTGRGNVLTAGLLQGADRPERANEVRAAVHAPQLSAHPAAQALRQVVQWPCKAAPEKISGLEFSIACVKNRAFRSHNPAELAQTFPEARMTLVGDVQGIPVMLLDHAGFEAVSVRYETSGPERHKPAIFVTTGLVNRLAGPYQLPALLFILGHEVGHAKHSHSMPEGEGPLAAVALDCNEKEADFHGFQHMAAQGMDPEQIRNGIELVMQEIHAIVKRENNPFLMALTRQRIRYLVEVLQNASQDQVQADASRAYVRHASR